MRAENFRSDPLSQQPFTWNGNNPISNNDSSGYCSTTGAPDSDVPHTTDFGVCENNVPYMVNPWGAAQDPATVGFKGGGAKVVISCPHGCYIAPLTGVAKARCTASLGELQEAGKSVTDFVHELDPKDDQIDSKTAIPEAAATEDQVEAEGIQGWVGSWGVLGMFMGFATLQGELNATWRAEDHVKRDCIITVH
jgi:hypothetical protein